ncbi:type I restriction endonuclease [Anaeroselena agilis]|uniref:S1 RNA-binding domain-containing protein n=1 Tax=Anaeroselena agilis TaxID=3063788 RepID=A0ABU3P2I5_9FIRM|nr:S1 RNA-binding domain-containing protein [Selenomonadales bacterium 4137-cl]
MSLYCDLSDLVTESDIEQKFIFPMLTNSNPLGLGYKPSDIRTKTIIRQVLIDKGSKQHYYFPDYLISLRGIPMMVVEAKGPNEDLTKAFSEARLYANEINSEFKHKLNVCEKIMVCNGREIWTGYFDQADPIVKLNFDEVFVGSKAFVNLIEFCSKDTLNSIVDKYYSDIKGKALYNTPVSKLGGKRVQDQELIENEYGRTLVFENRNIFDPQTEDDRIEIVNNAYVASAKREQHAEPLFKEIKKFKLPSEVNSTLISTDNPEEIVQKINKHIELKNDNYSLMLFIGTKGSGKTTFIRHFKEVFLKVNHIELYNQCEFIFINMNNAPGNKDKIYDWIIDATIQRIQDNHSEIDFTEFETIKKVFKKEIKEFEKGLGALLSSTPDKYNQELYSVLVNCTNNNQIKLKSYIKYLKETHTKIPIVVLDNCDKLLAEQQLLMFDVAQWLRDTFKCLILLPLRDTTYDNYRNTPPLDTVVKDLVFRIDPPDLFKVLQARLEYILRINANKLNEATTYTLENGITIHIEKNEQIQYFKKILQSIRNDRLTLKIFYNLSNRSIRDGIELFINFCKSGHVKAQDIFMIRVSGNEYEEQYSLPQHIILNTLLRKNRKYFDEEKSNFVNLFSSKYTDDLPDPFVRIDILSWLKDKLNVEGPSRVKGYHRVADIVADLELFGHKDEITMREIAVLSKRELIFAESQSFDIANEDLVKISPSGSVHLDLLENVTYLATCAENTLYKNSEIMIRISRRLSSPVYLEKISSIATALDMIGYLIDYRKEFITSPSVYLKDGTYLNSIDLNISYNAIKRLIDSDSEARQVFGFTEEFPVGTVVEAVVTNKKRNSINCHVENKIKGFLSILEQKYNLSSDNYEQLNIGDYIICKVLEFDFLHKSVQLEYVALSTKQNYVK